MFIKLLGLLKAESSACSSSSRPHSKSTLFQIVVLFNEFPLPRGEYIYIPRPELHEFSESSRVCTAVQGISYSPANSRETERERAERAAILFSPDSLNRVPTFIPA